MDKMTTVQPERPMVVVPPAAVLGVAGPFMKVRNVHPLFEAYNIHQLRTEVLAPFFPLPVRGLIIVLAVYSPGLPQELVLIFTNPDTQSSFSLNVSAVTFNSMNPPPLGAVDVAPFRAHAPWLLFGVPFPIALIEKPGQLRVTVRYDDREVWAGGLNFIAYEPEPLSLERIAALKSDPYGTKSARFSLSCKVCRDKITAFTGLDRTLPPGEEDAIWYADLPEFFECQCGQTSVSLSLLRRGFHAVLGERFICEEQELAITRLYELSSLEVIADSFAHVLESSTGESRLQEFLGSNPILLHFLAPKKTIAKAPILSKYQTDFAVLTASGELVLIELESDAKRLVRRNGHPTAELTHALSQVNDWLHEFRTHRLACLSNMQLKDEEVTRVRGLVVIGRQRGHNLEDLRRLKASNLGDVTLLTYDDLAANLAELIREVKRNYRPKPASD
jgi:Domain of unknown function (DUF4263)